MLGNREIRILYHILDCVGPDLERKDSGRFELKPEGVREYVEGISLSAEEYRIFSELKGKLQGALLSGLFSGRGK